MELYERAIEQVQFTVQRWPARFRQDHYEIVDHRAEASRHLKVLRAVETYFPTSQLHKIVPVWRLENDPEISIGVEQDIVVQVAATYRAQQAVKLVDGEYRRRRIVDCPRECFDSHVNDNPERKG